MSTRTLRARKTRSLVEGLERLQRKSAEDGKLQFLTYLISMAAHQATIEDRRAFERAAAGEAEAADDQLTSVG